MCDGEVQDLNYLFKFSLEKSTRAIFMQPLTLNTLHTLPILTLFLQKKKEKRRYFEANQL